MNARPNDRPLRALVRFGAAAALAVALACPGPLSAFSPMRFIVPGGVVPRWAPEAFPLQYAIQDNARQKAGSTPAP
ncbi:MAG: hypothetical protein HY303_05440 [Candidatus Wallbacteria bacterium]|nr:hypothetical protein [Candidatus Wallbacteria bacterium]